MKSKIYNLRIAPLWLFLLHLFTTACSSSKEDDVFHLYKTDYTISSDGGMVETNIVSNDPLSLVIPLDVDWIQEIVPSKGIEYFTLAVQVDPNLSYKPRTAILTLNHVKSSTSKQVTITQDGSSTTLSITKFGFQSAENPHLIDDVVGIIEGDAISVRVPHYTEIKDLIPNIAGDFKEVFINDEPFIPGQSRVELGIPAKIATKNELDEKREYELNFSVFTGLPIVHVNTEGVNINSKETYVNGTLSISKTTQHPDGFEGTIRIRGRGNSSWQFAKKPYRIKLDSKASLMGMPSDKDWVLLASATDRSLMRNAIAFELSRLTGLPWTPRMEFVDLYMNGSYQGTYMLGEHVKASSDRINITGTGAIGEKDTYYASEPFYTQSSVFGNYFTFKEPDPADITNTAYFMSLINQLEYSLVNQDFSQQTGYRNFIDLESFAKWHIIVDFLAWLDPNYYFFITDDSGLLQRGPVWDAEWTIGNVGWGITTPFSPTESMDNHVMYAPQLLADPVFKAEVKKYWTKMKNEDLSKLYAYIDQIARYIESSARANAFRWIGQEFQGSSQFDWAGEVEFMKNYLRTRESWLDQQISAW